MTWPAPNAAAVAVRRCLAAILTLPLAACLFTETPAFGPDEAVPADRSPELAAWIDIAAPYEWHEGKPAELPIPFWRTDEGDTRLSGLHVAAVIGDRLLLQEVVHDCDVQFCIGYYTVGLRPDGIPEICWYNTERAADLTEAAAAAGVALTTIDTGDDKLDLPPDIGASGPEPALRSFLIRAFTEGPLFCEAPPIGDETPPPPKTPPKAPPRPASP